MKPTLLSSLVVFAIGLTHASAATAVWVGSGAVSGNWSDGANWVGGNIPTDGDDIEVGTSNIRITSNNALTSIGNLWLKSNLNEVNGNALTLNGNLVRYTAGGSSIGKIGASLALTQNTTFEVAANTSNGRLEISGGISGAFSLTKSDGGRLRLVGTAKTYSGDTIITGGLLDMSANDMLPFGTGKGNVLIGTGGQLFLNNVNTQINGLSDYSGTAGTVSKSGSNTRSLTLGNANANGDFSGDITFTGGTSTIAKVGSGTQVLSGNISTAGAGSVSAGALLINGTWNNGVSATGTATLGGTGTINGAVNIAATAFLAPGASIESLAVTSATISGTLEIEYNGTGAGTIDLLAVTNALDITNATVDFAQLTAPADDASYIFATYGSLVGTQFASVVNLPSGYSIDYAFGGNNIALVSIPEPAAALLGSLGLLGLIRRRR